MGLKGSLQRSQEATTGSYPEFDDSSSHPPTHFFQINFNIILPYTPETSEIFRFGATKWSNMKKSYLSHSGFRELTSRQWNLRYHLPIIAI
jgi:hypothetical protein